MNEPEGSFLVQPRRVALACAAATALLGLMVLVAWLAGNEALKQVRPGWPTMKANTALAFASVGLGFALCLRGRVRTGQAVAAVALLVGTLTLAQYAFDVDLGVDELLFEDSGGTEGTTSPGRPAILTAANFVLVGLVLVTWPWPSRTALVANGAAGFVALFNLAFFFLGAIPPIEGTRMAVHTAAAFLLLCAGVALARSARLARLLLGHGSTSQTTRLLLAPVVLLPLLAGLAAQWSVASGRLSVTQARAFALFTNLVVLGILVGFTMLRLDAETRSRARLERDLQRALQRVDDAERVTARGSWEWDVSRDRAVWSPGMYRLLGVDPATFQNSNENFLALVHPDDRARMGQAITDALAKPGRFYQDYRVTRPDGSLRHLRGEGDVVPGTGGAPTMIYGVVADVTALKALEEAGREAERAVAESEARLRAIFDGNPVAIAISRADGTGIVDVNPAYEALLGYSRAEATAPGFDPSRLWRHPEDRARLLASLRHSGGGDAVELSLLRRDGQARDVLASIKPLRLGGQDMFLTALQDVTLTKQAQRRERQAQERFEGVFRSSPVPIALTKTDGRFVDVNAAFCRLVGRERAAMVDGAVRAPDVWEDPQERQRMLLNLRERGLVRDLEVRIKRPDGEVRTTLANLEFVDLGGDTTILALLQDITERERARAEREERIKAEAELERLRRTDRFRTEFINSTSHELATPLTPLVINVRTLAADASLTPTQRRLVDSMERSVSRLRQLVADMVGAADLQARNVSLDRRRLNLTRELRAAVAAHQAAAERAGLALEDGEDAAATVSADPARLQLALGHLLGNAIKFTPPGGRVVVRSRRVGELVRVEVQDTGPGLTRKEVEELFRPFAQVHDKSQRTDSGSGLGLYVTKGIIELHGGAVGVASDGPGKGSTFWFTLPLATGHVDPLPKAGRAEAPPAPSGPRRDLNPGVAGDEAKARPDA